MKPPSYEEIRRNINRRYNRVFWLIVHITLAVVTAELLWMTDPTPQNGNPRITIPWFGLILIHTVKVVMDILKEREMAGTWKRYYGDLEADEVIVEEKPKRLARLMDESEDDELAHEHNGHAHHHDEGRRQKGS